MDNYFLKLMLAGCIDDTQIAKVILATSNACDEHIINFEFLYFYFGEV